MSSNWHTSHQNAGLELLDPDSHTAQKLRHATSQHLHLTTRRCFIGPIPEGWLKSHRRDWYKHHLRITNPQSRAPTFTAQGKVDRRKRLTGLDGGGPSASAQLGQSFPQPGDVEALAEEDEEGADRNADANGREQEAVVNGAPAVRVPRSSNPSEGGLQQLGQDEETERTSETEAHSLDSPALSGLSPDSTRGRSKSRSRRPGKAAARSASFVTAQEGPPSPEVAASLPKGTQQNLKLPSPGPPRSTSNGDRNRMSMAGSTASGQPGERNSTAALLPETSDSREPQRPGSAGVKGIISKVAKAAGYSADPEGEPPQLDGTDNLTSRREKRSLAHVRFDSVDPSARKDLQVKARVAQLGRRRSIVRKTKLMDGEILKMEKMLVRVDVTAQQLPDDFDENEAQKTETRTKEKWREFMVVCREGYEENADFLLQMYKTRVIPAIEEKGIKHKSEYEIVLNKKRTRVNLYSALDKTVVIWTPAKRGTDIYIIQPRASSNSVEWYTFLRNLLGWQRPSMLQVNVPDLDVSLRLENPFEKLEASRDLIQAAEDDEEAINRTLQEEQAIAGDLVDKCMTMLEKAPEYHDVVTAWAKDHPIGLAWKRYDRLEWIYGANERRMYGTMAMQKSHELEIRPKSHYPTTVRSRKKHTLLEEPAPVEGFLIRLTSQRGVDQKLGRLFFKRLYFSTHNQFLVFNRPARATPPPPPTLPMHPTAKIPTAHQIAEKIPLIYAVNPYPLDHGEIAWLRSSDPATAEQKEVHDKDAYDESERIAEILLNCDGYINLANVVKVRNVVRGATPADENIEEGSDVDFNEDVPDTHVDDGVVRQFDDDRTFELLLRNGLVIRLQAYDKETKQEWKTRLRELVKYWKTRTVADIDLYKSIRAQNLEVLNIDEESEAYVGQFARKWEVTKSAVSPELYNICGIASCRTIHMAGTLYRKPRRHATFTRCSVILTHGHLLVFQDTLRKATGKELQHIHHERISSIDLSDCYLYSGLITESDLLYQNRTFDSNKPGHHALPRIYMEDGWTSTDEDYMTSFVLWHGRRKSWFRSEVGVKDEKSEKVSKRSRLKLVSQLGVPGRSVVFKARSRAERDHWVMAVGVEIERLSRSEDVRIIGEAEG